MEKKPESIILYAFANNIDCGGEVYAVIDKDKKKMTIVGEGGCWYAGEQFRMEIDFVRKTVKIIFDGEPEPIVYSF